MLVFFLVVFLSSYLFDRMVLRQFVHMILMFLLYFHTVYLES